MLAVVAVVLALVQLTHLVVLVVVDLVKLVTVMVEQQTQILAAVVVAVVKLEARHNHMRVVLVDQVLLLLKFLPFKTKLQLLPTQQYGLCQQEFHQ
jgi:hypothetical protein